MAQKSGDNTQLRMGECGLRIISITDWGLRLPATMPARARPLAKHREADGPCVAGGSSA